MYWQSVGHDYSQSNQSHYVDFDHRHSKANFTKDDVSMSIWSWAKEYTLTHDDLIAFPAWLAIDRSIFAKWRLGNESICRGGSNCRFEMS